MSKLITRASSINRALDQIGDKWCLLIIQEVFWGIHSFNEMMNAMGVSKGVLSNRLQWLQSLDCLSKHAEKAGGTRMRYHLTRKSVELYDSALMAIVWEREFFRTPELDTVTLTHLKCGQQFEPEMRCRNCGDEIQMNQVQYKPGPGATYDERDKKVRRRSSISVLDSPSDRNLYKNLIHLVGDRWTANVIALAFDGHTRFDQFHEELPVATNILTDRLKFLVEEGIFRPCAYQQKPRRHEYQLTEKGKALYPWFLSLQQWGDKWCRPRGAGRPVSLGHKSCRRALHGEVICSVCGGKLKAPDVSFN